jgi:hypothetical protein
LVTDFNPTENRVAHAVTYTARSISILLGRARFYRVPQVA